MNKMEAAYFCKTCKDHSAWIPKLSVLNRPQESKSGDNYSA